MAFFTKASGRSGKFAIVGQAVIEGLKVECKLAYEKSTEGWAAILYAEIDAASFGMAAVFPGFLRFDAAVTPAAENQVFAP